MAELRLYVGKHGDPPGSGNAVECEGTAERVAILTLSRYGRSPSGSW